MVLALRKILKHYDTLYDIRVTCVIVIFRVTNREFRLYFLHFKPQFCSCDCKANDGTTPKTTHYRHLTSGAVGGT